MASFLASIYAPETWWTYFLYRTTVGRALFRLIWRFIPSDLNLHARYDRLDGKENGFANLRPDTELFWQNDSSGVNQKPDFYDTMAKSVKIHRQDIDESSSHSIHLADEMSIQTDAVVFATGWKASLPYIALDLAFSLGISVDVSAGDTEESREWQIREEKVDAEVLGRFPILEQPPPYYKHKHNDTPFRLYRAIFSARD